MELRMLPWMDYVRELSLCYIGIHLDTLFTRGQFALECAGLGIPCICSGSDAGMQLFPDTFVDNPWDVDRAVELGTRLIEDENFYESVSSKASETLVSQFSYEVINKQVREITGIE